MLLFKSLFFGKFPPAYRAFSTTSSCHEKFRNIDQVIPKNVLDIPDNNGLQTENGKCYDLKPCKLHLKKDKVYAWCLCGNSKCQPLCDTTHTIQELNIQLKPIFFQVKETKDYWLCNCKRTLHRPFCDGSHVKLAREHKERELAKQESRKILEAEGNKA